MDPLGAPKELNVLMMTDSFLPHAGGSRVYYHNIYSRFAPDQVTVLTKKVPGWREFDARECRPDYRIVRHFRPLPDHRYRQIPRALLPLAPALQILLTQSVDLVHSGDLFPQGIFAEMFWRCGGIPYLAYCHGEEITQTEGYRFRPYLRTRVYRGAAAVIANSNFARNLLLDLGIPLERIHKVTPGVDLAQFFPRERRPELVSCFALQGQLVLVTVARLVARKGHDTVIRSVAGLANEFPNLKYLVVGSGPDRPALEQLARELNVAERVVFTGHVPEADLADFYALGDVMVMPNRRESGGDLEGFGMSFVEANAVGRPVVGGRSGGAEEAVAEHVSGLLLEDPRSVEELVSVLRLLLGSQDLRQRMGTAGAQRARQEFGWQGRAERIRQISREVVNRTRQGAVPVPAH
jgi:phosphatidyl-myo-inositol dimannoside synthase